MKILQTIIEKRENLLKGNINCIPLPFIGSRAYYSGISPGQLVCITAETSVGKTSLAKFLYVFSVADYMLALPDELHLDYHCYWFGLEESLEEFEVSILQYALSQYYKLYVTQDELLSRITPLNPTTIELIESEFVQRYFKLCKSFVHFDEVTANPTGIFKECEKIADERGTHHFIEGTTKKGEVINKYDYYEPKNPNEIVVAVIDNVNILEGEKSEQGHTLELPASIDKMVNSYARKKMSKHWKWHVCCIHQLQMAAGDLAHFKAGKLDPDTQKLGDNTRVGRSYQVVMGLTSPKKHNISVEDKYQIIPNNLTNGLEDCYRAFHITKNRFGRSNTKESLFFNPKGFSFEKLPLPDSPEMERYFLLKDQILN